MWALLICTALAATMASASAFGATQYLVNGGFETGDLTGWTESGDSAFTSVEFERLWF